MFSSTVDRQLARDREVQADAFLAPVVTLRRALAPAGADTDAPRKLRSKCTAGCGLIFWARSWIHSMKFAVQGPLGHAPIEMRRSVRVSAPLLTLWTILAKGVEIPLSYIIQKVFVLLLVLSYFYHNLLPASSNIAVYSRYLRIVTTVILCPLNHYLGRLRIRAFAQVEEKRVLLFLAEIPELRAQAEQLREMVGKLQSGPKAAVDLSAVQDSARRLAAAFGIVDSMAEDARVEVAELGRRNAEALTEGLGSDRASDKLCTDLYVTHKLVRAKVRAAGILRAALDHDLHYQAAVESWREIGSRLRELGLATGCGLSAAAV
eukprot:RCo046117